MKHQKISWTDIPKTKVVELKELLTMLVTLLENYDKTVELLGLKASVVTDYVSLRFSIFISNHADLIRLGETLEAEYLRKIEEFNYQISSNYDNL